MNSKTTLLLFAAVVAVGAAIYFLQEKAPPKAPAVATPPPDIGETSQKPVLEGEFGEVVEIDVQQPDQPVWKFTKEPAKADDKAALPGASTSDWKLVAPMEGKAQGWQADQLAKRLTDLKYTLKYDAGKPGMTAAEAGLDAPRASVTLVNKDGKKHTFYLGRNDGDDATFVRVDESQAIFQAKPSLKGLLKNKPVEYLEQQVFSIPADKVVRLSIDAPGEQAGVKEHIELVKSGGQWVLEKPTAGKTVAEKVNRLAATFGTLRVVNWVEQAADPAVFGLGDDALTVTATVEEKAETPPANATSNGAPTPSPAAPVVKTYTVRFSKNTPLGENTKVYLRRGDEKLVGAVMKTQADTFRPNLKEWRDNRLLDRDPTLARKVEIGVGDAKATFVRGQADWTQEGANTPADRAEMQSFLNSLKGANALNFEEGATADPAKFGLDAPQAIINLTFDGQEQPVKVAVGGYADPDTKRLVFVRVGEGDSVAKLRVADAEALVRQPATFRDRGIVSVTADRLQKIDVDRADVHGLDPAVRIAQTVEQAGGTWKLTAPVAADANSNGIAALVGALADLRGTRVIDLAEGASLAEYGLDSPSAKVAMTYKAAAPPADAGSNGAADAGASEGITLALAHRDKEAFALRGDNDHVVYALDPATYDALTGELQDGKVLKYEDVKVTSILVEQNGKTQGFKKDGVTWTFVPEGDIPVEFVKVMNLLLRVKDLRALHYVAYGVTDFAPFGLDKPAITCKIESDGKPDGTLLVSAKANAKGELFARMDGGSEVFVLPADAPARLKIDIAEFEKSPTAANAGRPQ